MFFSLLPNIEYSQNRTKYRFTDQDFVLAKNIFTGITLDNSLYATDLFAEFTIKDGTRPDMIAETIYNNPFYDWVVLLTNNIKNLQNDWPLSSDEFEIMIAKKYDDAFSIKHWKTKELINDIGEVVQPKDLIVYYDPTNPASYTLRYIKSYNPRVEEIEFGDTLLESVSYYEYEQELNEKKKVIQILKPAYLQLFVNLFKASVSYAASEQLDTSRSDLKKTLNVENIFSNKTL